MRSRASVTIIGIVLIPMAVALACHGAVGICDLASQAGLLLMTVAFPFTAPLCWSAKALFGLEYGVWFLWGCWRLFFFDVVTNNDIPGMGYLIAPLLWCGLAALLFYVRQSREKSQQQRVCCRPEGE